MKIVFKNCRHSAMSWVGILALIGVFVVVAYLFGRYQTGEFLQISWRKSATKTAAKTNSVLEPIRPSDIRLVEEIDPPDQPAEIQETNTKSVSVSTNLPKKSSGENPTTEIAGTRLDEWKKRKVLVPTNAVWSTKSRKQPGVRIAFP